MTVSAGARSEGPAQAGFVSPAVYEVGRGEAVRLPETKPAAGTPSPWWTAILLAIVLTLVLVSIYGAQWLRIAGKRPIGTLILLSIAGGLLWKFLHWVHPGDAWKEPLSLTNGISLWGPIYLQALALVLSLIFLIYVFFRVRSNARKIERRYFWDAASREIQEEEHSGGLLACARRELRSYVREAASWGRKAPVQAREILESWRFRTSRHRRGKGCVEGPSVIWQRYRGRVTFVRRAPRVFSVSVLFFLLVVTLYSATGGGASNPARGEAIREVCLTLRLLDMFAMALLAFGVRDAALKCRDFIRELAEAAVAHPHLQWPAAGVNRVRSRELGGIADINPWIALSLIAEHSDAVARLVIYPLFVLVLLVVARWSWFDTVTMPPSVLIAYVAFSFYILIAA